MTTSHTSMLAEVATATNVAHHRPEVGPGVPQDAGERFPRCCRGEGLLQSLAAPSPALPGRLQLDLRASPLRELVDQARRVRQPRVQPDSRATEGAGLSVGVGARHESQGLVHRRHSPVAGVLDPPQRRGQGVGVVGGCITRGLGDHDHARDVVSHVVVQVALELPLLNGARLQDTLPKTSCRPAWICAERDGDGRSQAPEGRCDRELLPGSSGQVAQQPEDDAAAVSAATTTRAGPWVQRVTWMRRSRSAATSTIVPLEGSVRRSPSPGRSRWRSATPGRAPSGSSRGRCGRLAEVRPWRPGRRLTRLSERRPRTEMRREPQHRADRDCGRHQCRHPSDDHRRILDLRAGQHRDGREPILARTAEIGSWLVTCTGIWVIPLRRPVSETAVAIASPRRAAVRRRAGTERYRPASCAAGAPRTLDPWRPGP